MTTAKTTPFRLVPKSPPWPAGGMLTALTRSGGQGARDSLDRITVWLRCATRKDLAE